MGAAAPEEEEVGKASAELPVVGEEALLPEVPVVAVADSSRASEPCTVLWSPPLMLLLWLWEKDTRGPPATPPAPLPPPCMLA